MITACRLRVKTDDSILSDEEKRMRWYRYHDVLRLTRTAEIQG